jgi:hypothetical protein
MANVLMNRYRLETVPLVYDSKADTSKITNILLIDQSVSSYEIFVKSANTQTFPIVYNRRSTREELGTLSSGRVRFGGR